MANIGDKEKDQWERWDKRIKDGALFTVAIAGMVNELWRVQEIRPAVLTFLLAIFGIPIVMDLDALRRRKNGNGNGS